MALTDAETLKEITNTNSEEFVELFKYSHPVKHDLLRMLLTPRLSIEYLPNYNKSWDSLEYACKGDHCFDLRAAIDSEFLEIYPGDVIRVPNGIRVAVPPPFAMYIFMRSGWSKLGIQLANGVGVIDQSYRGEVCTQIINNSSMCRVILQGERISQASLVLSPKVSFMERQIDINETKRGSGGFGHTGT
jgi:dUTP pyrophosphatase